MENPLSYGNSNSSLMGWDKVKTANYFKALFLCVKCASIYYS